MGLTMLEMQIGNPANPDLTETVELLVDSGAIYSVVPEPVLARLGIKPLIQQEFRLADGSKIVRKKGGALFKYEDRIGVADVIFGEEGDGQLLGAFTLEALGFALRSAAAGIETPAYGPGAGDMTPDTKARCLSAGLGVFETDRPHAVIGVAQMQDDEPPHAS